MSAQTMCVMYKTKDGAEPSEDLLWLQTRWPNAAEYSNMYVFASRPPECTEFLDLQEASVEEVQALFVADEQPTKCIFVTDAQVVAIYDLNVTAIAAWAASQTTAVPIEEEE